MRFDLVPKENILFRTRRLIAVGGSITLVILWPIVAFGICNKLQDAWIPSILMLCFGLFLWYPSVRYERIARSTVTFSNQSMDFLDQKGLCWRSMPYDSITAVYKSTVYGTFYGINRDNVEGVYLCFTLNGSRDVPNEKYYRLFSHKDFTMIYFQDEIVSILKSKGIELATTADSKIFTI